MDKIVIIINGAGGVGKDTLCEAANKVYPTLNVSAITPVKDIALRIGWDGQKDDKSRKFLSDLKRALIEYNNLPNMYLLGEYAKFKKDNNVIMFAHIREKDQIDEFLRQIDIPRVTLLVRRQCQKPAGNPSDDNVEDYSYDYYYENKKPICELEEDFLAFLKALLINEGILKSFKPTLFRR